jgi:hypothetical protein
MTEHTYIESMETEIDRLIHGGMHCRLCSRPKYAVCHSAEGPDYTDTLRLLNQIEARLREMMSQAEHRAVAELVGWVLEMADRLRHDLGQDSAAQGRALARISALAVTLGAETGDSKR